MRWASVPLTAAVKTEEAEARMLIHSRTVEESDADKMLLPAYLGSSFFSTSVIRAW
jgi:hypothetical protein